MALMKANFVQKKHAHIISLHVLVQAIVFLNLGFVMETMIVSINKMSKTVRLLPVCLLNSNALIYDNAFKKVTNATEFRIVMTTVMNLDAVSFI